VFTVPLACRTACWLNAWLGGRESADAVIDGLSCGGDADFVWDRGEAPLSAALLLGELRRRAVTHVTPALPIAGDPVGLGGPPAFNRDALEAGGAVVVHGTGRGFVPMPLGSRTRWLGAVAAAPVYLPDLATADHDLREAMRAATEALVTLDVTSWNPDVADAVMNLRSPTELDGPMAFASPRAAQTTLAALRAAAIVDLAGVEGSGPVSAGEMTARAEALRPLRHASHQALVAACGSRDGR
jgi:hypothetical protein